MDEENIDRMLKEIDSVAEPIRKSKLVFGVTQRPPIHISIFYGLQVALTIISGPIAVSFVVHRTVCAEGDSLFLAELISSSLFAVGVATVLQVTIGTRLPILQGSSMFYVYTLQSIMETDKWKCPEQNVMSHGNVSAVHSVPADSISNLTLPESSDMSALWRPRVLEVSGGLVIASVFHFLLGALGLVGFLTRFVGPLTVTPVIGLIALNMYFAINVTCRNSWPIALFTVAVAIISGIVLGNTKCPVPSWDRKKGCQTTSYPVFRIFATNIALISAWILCGILTVAGVFPDTRGEIGFYARTDAKIEAFYNTKWFNVPYPGQWGMPAFSWVTAIGFIPIVVGSVIESVGDYIATANACEVERPPTHAINRGIAMEGVASFLSGFIGTCHATTSYSNMVGLIAYTAVGSRFVWFLAGLICIIGGVFGKCGAALASVPEPAIGGLMLISMSMVFSAAMMNLARVDMASPRNQMILGLAIVLGVSLPLYAKAYPDDLKTGHPSLDQIVGTLMSGGAVIGGLIGFVLDNILPGSRESRGMADARASPQRSDDLAIYDLPFTSRFRKVGFFRYIPFLPCFKDDCSCCCRRKGGKAKAWARDEEEDGLENGRP